MASNLISVPRLILASGSPRRNELLSVLGIPFEIIVPNIPEDPLPDESPENLVLRLSAEKGLAVSAGLPDAVVLAADTIVVLDPDCEHGAESDRGVAPIILGKPADRNDAIAMLKSIQGREHTVFTGVAVVCGDYRRFGAARPVLETFIGCSRVEIASLTDDEIENYVDTGEPMDKAGGYAVQGRGASFIASIQGSYTNVVGLPLAEVRMSLKRLGFGSGL